MSQISSSEYATWLSKLNAIRVKHSLSSIGTPSPTVTTGSLTQGTQMKQFRNNVHSTYNNVTRLRQKLISIQGNFNKGHPMSLGTKTDINTTLTALEGICAVDPCVVNNNCTNAGGYSNYSDNSTHQYDNNSQAPGYTDNVNNQVPGECSNYSKCQTCSTNANFTQCSTYAVNSNTLPIEAT